MIAFWKVVKTKTNLRRCNVIIYYYSQGSYMPKFRFDWRRGKKLIDFFVVNWYLDCAFKKGVPYSKYLRGGREMHKQTHDGSDCSTPECPWAVCSAPFCSHRTTMTALTDIRRTLLLSFAGDTLQMALQESEFLSGGNPQACRVVHREQPKAQQNQEADRAGD